MPKEYKRHFIKTKRAKTILKKASEKLNVNLEQIFKSKINMELIETDFGEIFLINGKPLMFKRKEEVFPTLIFKEVFDLAPKAIVDMGAIPHVCNGADVMAPGIVGYKGNFSKGDIVFIVDEKYNKPLAVGEATQNVEDAKTAKHGVIIKNIHFVGDKIWKLIKNVGG